MTKQEVEDWHVKEAEEAFARLEDNIIMDVSGSLRVKGNWSYIDVFRLLNGFAVLKKNLENIPFAEEVKEG
jgi:hypothetical protein